MLAVATGRVTALVVAAVVTMLMRWLRSER
jgi:hypothetical protein